MKQEDVMALRRQIKNVVKDSEKPVIVAIICDEKSALAYVEGNSKHITDSLCNLMEHDDTIVKVLKDALFAHSQKELEKEFSAAVQKGRASKDRFADLLDSLRK